jgi:V/A-type H+/Na+-transporting ATPase subunit I
MAIVKLRKVTVYGLLRQRDEVLDRLQTLGCLHLIDLQKNGELKTPEHPHRNVVHEALKYLDASSVQNPNHYTRYPSGCDCLQVAHQALENKRHRQELNDERDHLRQSIRVLEPWGDFQWPSPEQLGGLQLWFYPVRHHDVAQLQRSELVWKAVAEDHQFVYVVVVGAEEPVGVPGHRVDLDQRPLSQLKARLEAVDEELESLHWQQVALTRWTRLLSRDLDVAEDEVARMEALHRLMGDEHIFALQGWAPVISLDAIQDFARQHQLALMVERPAAEDEPPTLMKNPRVIAGAEGAVRFYMTPAYRAWDPTWVMFFSFSFFFAMIMSDAAYGLVLGAIVFLLWRKLSGSEDMRRFRNLLLAIVTATILYGVVAGSYFGMTLPGLDRLQWRINGEPLVKDRDAMMLISITIGVLHLTLANLITAWRNWGRSQALSSLGWAFVFLGGLIFGLAWPDPSPVAEWVAQQLNQSSAAVQAGMANAGLGAIIGGLVAVLLFSSTRPLFTTRISDWVWRILDGLQGLTNVTRAFGDTLSYLRLFALGLASTQLAVTFNDLARGALEVPGLGILLAILILLVGHGINLVLGVMGGVVHGLRLNCIEFFNWSLTDEGYPFRAFCKKAGS